MGTFKLQKARDDQFFFNLHAGNSERILTSEMYTTKGAAFGGIASVKENAPNNDRYEKRTAQSGQFYFILKAANHQVIGKSEMYSSESGRDNGIASVKSSAPAAKTEDLTA